jgi:hypothetical protein
MERPMDTGCSSKVGLLCVCVCWCLPFLPFAFLLACCLCLCRCYRYRYRYRYLMDGFLFGVCVSDVVYACGFVFAQGGHQASYYSQLQSNVSVPILSPHPPLIYILSTSLHCIGCCFVNFDWLLCIKCCICCICCIGNYFCFTLCVCWRRTCGFRTLQVSYWSIFS